MARKCPKCGDKSLDFHDGYWVCVWSDCVYAEKDKTDDLENLSNIDLLDKIKKYTRFLDYPAREVSECLRELRSRFESLDNSSDEEIVSRLAIE